MRITSNARSLRLWAFSVLRARICHATSRSATISAVIDLAPSRRMASRRWRPLGFWTPNGRHRLEALRRLGAKSITALIVADREVAWQILALNTEKAHNLRERALEVIRIYRGLVEEDAARPESKFAFYLNEPALVTLGVCYERLPRFGGGVYHSILRRLEAFTDDPLRTALKDHEKRATLVLDLEEKVAAAVKKLKERGLVSPYLRAFVVARINPLRWIKGEPPPL